MLKRIIVLSISLSLSLLFSSCLTIEEVLKLNADGSGVLTSSIDMGELLSNPMMKMAMEEEMEKNGEDMPERIDSNLNIIEELLPLNPQWTKEDIALLNKVESKMIMDFTEGEGGVFVTMPFENLDQLMRMQKLMADANEPEGGDEDNPFSGLSNGSGSTISTYVWKQGRLSRNTSMTLGLVEELGNSEEMDMMKMMFGDAKLIFKMEFPGDIKKVKGYPGHDIVNGNTLVQEFDFLDLFDNEDKIDEGLDGMVKYKK